MREIKVAMCAAEAVPFAKVGGLAESVVDGKTGFHAQPDDPHSWADKLGRLLDDPKLRREMGRNGRHRVESHYTWQAVVRKYYPPLLDGERLSKGTIK